MVASKWSGMAHEWLMVIGVVMVAAGIVPALWRHRSIAVGAAAAGGMVLWGLALLDPAHGAMAGGLEVAGAACLVGAHWMNMIAARRLLVRCASCEQGCGRAADVVQAG